MTTFGSIFTLFSFNLTTRKNSIVIFIYLWKSFCFFENDKKINGNFFYLNEFYQEIRLLWPKTIEKKRESCKKLLQSREESFSVFSSVNCVFNIVNFCSNAIIYIISYIIFLLTNREYFHNFFFPGNKRRTEWIFINFLYFIL